MILKEKIIQDLSKGRYEKISEIFNKLWGPVKLYFKDNLCIFMPKFFFPFYGNPFVE